MPNTREKLIELLTKYFDIGDSYAYNLTRVKSAFACGTMGFDDFEEFDDETVADIADHLIANGVTVQEWIPVTERLPEQTEPATAVLGITKKGRCHIVYYYKGVTDDRFTGFYDIGLKVDVTHWMPLPQPPKGE